MKYPAAEYAKFLISVSMLPAQEQKISLKKLANLLDKNGDIKEWERISDLYKAILQKTAKTKKATVKYSGEIHKNKITEALKGYDVEFVEEKANMGGIAIQIGDMRIDNTISGRLAEIKKTLMS